MDKFYNFVGDDELYIYGDIIGGTEKYYEDDITFKDFKDKLDSMKENSTLNIYINSGGGSVTATQGIIGILNKAKRDKRIKTKCYIDGLAGSCASWLPMICDEVYCYNTSLLMMHKPMIGFFMEMLNANDLQKNINILDTIEETMLNAYESKINNSTRDEIKKMVDDETWLTAEGMCEIFNINLLDDNKELVAKVSNNILKNYKKVPKVLQDSLEEYNKKSKEEADYEDRTHINNVEVENKIKNIDIDLELLNFELFGI